MRLSGTKTGSIHQYRGLGDQLWDLGGARPSLDLNFAHSKDLTDATTGKDYVDFTRASSGTYVDSDGLIKTATTNLLLQSEDFSTTWATNALLAFGSGSTTNAAIAPDGTLTADLITDDGATNANHFIQQTFTGVDNAAYTLSVYAKSGTTDYIRIRLGDKAGTGGRAWFDLSNGTVTSVDATYTASIQSVGDGWYRLVLFTPTLKTGALAPAAQIFTQNATGNQTSYQGDGSSVYIWGAQLEQSSTVGEYVPTTSTINSAPRFDHDPTTGESLGLLVEESRTNLLLQSEDFSTTWGNTLLTDNVDATAAPNGTITADEIIETTATNIRSKEQNITSVASAVYTLSVFAKSGNGDKRYLRLSLNSAASTALWAAASYDLDDGTVASSDSAGGGTVTSTSIQPFGNGWYRCMLTGNIGANTDLRALVTLTPSSSTYTPNGRGRTSYTGDGVSSIYLWGAQLEEGSFPTSYIPTEGSTVTRAADVASISGSNFGAFRTNLLEYSEEFDDASWAKTRTTVIPNLITAPDGTLTADKLVEDTSTTTTHFFQQILSVSAATQYTLSAYFKAAERTWVLFLTGGTPFGSNGYYINLSTGDLGSDVGTTDVLPTVQNVGNGWYRVSITKTTTSSGNGTLQVRTATGDGEQVYTGDGTSGIYIWGAQLEEGSTATDYIKSDVNFVSRASSATYYDANGVIQTAAVDEARTAAYLPDGNGNFVSAGPLLLEDAGTNLIVPSVPDDGTSWNVGTNVSATENDDVSPDSTSSATYYEITAGPAQQFVSYDATVTASTAYTFSFYIKNDTASDLEYSVLDLIATADIVPATSYLSQVNTDSYTRISFSFTTPVGCTSARVFIFRPFGETGAFYAWGAQLEEGSYATSYIPTTSSTATRAADVSTSAATTVFESDWYRQDEGTFFANVLYKDKVRNNRLFFTESDANGFNDRHGLVGGGNSSGSIGPYGETFIAGSSQASLNQGSPSPNTRYVVAYAYKQDNFGFSRNGATAVTDTSGNLLTNQSYAWIGQSLNANWMNSPIARLAFWPSRLPNETLQTITQ